MLSQMTVDLSLKKTKGKGRKKWIDRWLRWWWCKAYLWCSDQFHHPPTRRKEIRRRSLKTKEAVLRFDKTIGGLQSMTFRSVVYCLIFVLFSDYVNITGFSWLIRRKTCTERNNQTDDGRWRWKRYFYFEAEEQSFFFKSGIKAGQNHSRFAIDAY